jgi:hypothetical protein
MWVAVIPRSDFPPVPEALELADVVLESLAELPDKLESSAA